MLWDVGVWYPRYVSFIMVRLYGSFTLRLVGIVAKRVTFIWCCVGGEIACIGDREESFRGESCM